MADVSPRHRPVSPHKRSKYGSRSRSPARGRTQSRSRSASRSPNVLPDATNPGNNLFVTGLSTRTSERELEDYFSKEGKVLECRLVIDARTKASRGFAFITMDTIENADRCIKYLHHTTLDGRVIKVEKARRRRPRTPTPGRYLGLRRTRDVGYGRHRYESSRDSYYYQRRDYSPEYSPYRGSGRYRRDQSPSPRYSPYQGSRRGYSRSRSLSHSPYSR